MKKMLRIILDILLSILSVIGSAVFFSCNWVYNTWSELSMEEVLFHIRAPFNGTSTDMIWDYSVHYGLPALLIPAALIVLLFLSRKQSHPLRKLHLPCVLLMVFLLIAALGVTWHRMDQRLDLATAYENQTVSSPFIENNYVDPSSVNIQFPERKRNLIYIYLESLEVTYADKDSGGAFDKNYIPELTRLAEENLCFSGSSGVLNGGISLPGTTWTMGAMFAETSGLPLKIGLSANDMNSQESFFPAVTTLGDILADEGYHNLLLIGSDADFGGRKLYFTQHGQYDILDYYYALNNGLIPEDYYVFWGYEDERLFDFAKSRLTELAAEDAPFNLTMLTVDTHFEDGYVCDQCDTEFGDDQYANVIACSSRQLDGFIHWIQEQDFYENTTVILSGDHPTMDRNFCEGVDPSYQRSVYTLILNDAPQETDTKERRTFDTFDFFPTTLAALGAEIPGNRLGLGVNLYSDEPTLVEAYGLDTCWQELSYRSEFMDRLTEFKATDELITILQQTAFMDISVGEDGNIAVSARNMYNYTSIDGFLRMEVEYWDSSQKRPKHQILVLDQLDDERGFYSDTEIDGIAPENLAVFERIVLQDRGPVTLRGYYGALQTGDICEYLDALRQGDYVVFIAASDEATVSLNDEIVQKLWDLGTRIDIRGHVRCSYYAVLDLTKRSTCIAEEMSDTGIISTSGTINGIQYEVTSAGFDFGPAGFICLDGENFSLSHRGLNFVVLDKTHNIVVSSVCFDTYDPSLAVSRE